MTKRDDSAVSDPTLGIGHWTFFGLWTLVVGHCFVVSLVIPEGGLVILAGALVPPLDDLLFVFPSPAAPRIVTFAPSVNRLKLSAATTAPGANPLTSETLPSVVTTVTGWTATL